MAYILYKSNGIQLTTIEDGSIDKSSTSLVLVGKNFSGYGQSINQNLIKLIENFAHNTQPSNSLPGQLWYDTATKSIKCYSGTRYKKLAVIDNGLTGKPADAVQGNLFFDDSEQKLYYYDGNSWLLIGPQFTGLTSKNLILPVQKYGTLGTDDKHYLLLSQIQLGTTTAIAAITSADSFTLDTGSLIPGFTQIKYGITLPGTDSFGVSATGPSTNAALLWGTASDALRLNGKLASDYVTKVAATAEQLTLTTDTGLAIGTGASSLILRVDTDAYQNKEAVISAPATAYVLRFYTRESGTDVVNIVNFDSSDGLAILPSLSSVGTNIGGPDAASNNPSKKPFENIYGKNIIASRVIQSPVYNSDSERDDTITTPQSGMIILNGNKFQGYVGGEWVDLN